MSGCQRIPCREASSGQIRDNLRQITQGRCAAVSAARDRDVPAVAVDLRRPTRNRDTAALRNNGAAPHVQAVTRRRDLDIRRRAPVQNGPSPRSDTGIGDAMVQVDASDTVAVEHQTQPGARRRPLHRGVRRPSRRIRGAGSRTVCGQRRLAVGVPDPAGPGSQCDRRGGLRAVRGHPAACRTEPAHPATASDTDRGGAVLARVHTSSVPGSV